MNMQKVISASLDGRVFVLEATGYDRLRAWLDESAARLHDNPDRDEILSDLERSLADKCAAVLLTGRQFISNGEIESMLAELGPIDTGAETKPRAGAAPGRLYQIREGAVLTGLCRGLGAHFAVDVLWFRIGFVALTFITGGAALLLYLILGLLIPYEDAPTPPTAFDVLQANVRSMIEQLRRLFGGSAGPRSDLSGRARR